MSEQQTEIVIAFVEPEYIGDRGWNDGYVLFAKGETVEGELKLQGRNLEDWIIYEIPERGCVGVMVWEGVCANAHWKNQIEWEPRLLGKWRLPTQDELLLLPVKPPASGVNEE